MIERQGHFDVSTVPVGHEFVIEGVSTYWNSMQTKNDLWVGFIGRGELRVVSTLIIFPENRPWKKYWATKAVNQSKILIDPETYDPKNYYFLVDDNKKWIYWKVLQPKPGYGYQLRWEWEGFD